MKKKLSFHVPHVYVIIATIILIVAALAWRPSSLPKSIRSL